MNVTREYDAEESFPFTETNFPDGTAFLRDGDLYLTGAWSYGGGSPKATVYHFCRDGSTVRRLVFNLDTRSLYKRVGLLGVTYKVIPWKL